MEFFNTLLNDAASVFSTLYGICINLPWVDLFNAVIDVLAKLV